MIKIVKSFTTWTKVSPDITFQILESYTSCVARNLVDRPNHMCNLSLIHVLLSLPHFPLHFCHYFHNIVYT